MSIYDRLCDWFKPVAALDRIFPLVRGGAKRLTH